MYVRRAFANGRVKQPRTRLSRGAVPLQAKALEALDHLPPAEDEILFPNARGGRIDFRSFGRGQWKPAQQRAGIEPLRGLYDLRHIYAAFALRAAAHPSASSASANSPRKDSVSTETLVKPALRRTSGPWDSMDHVSSSAPARPFLGPEHGLVLILLGHLPAARTCSATSSA